MWHGRERGMLVVDQRLAGMPGYRGALGNDSVLAQTQNRGGQPPMRTASTRGQPRASFLDCWHDPEGTPLPLTLRPLTYLLKVGSFSCHPHDYLSNHTTRVVRPKTQASTTLPLPDRSTTVRTEAREAQVGHWPLPPRSNPLTGLE